MVGACEASEVLALLEGGAGGAREAAEQLAALYGGVREPWLVRGLLAHHARTGSQRALELLARAPEPHARFLLDALAEQLRADRGARRHALAALAPLAARRPAWLHRLPQHAAARELVRAARSERDPLPLLHALLALAALLPAAPALAAPHWPELADALLRPAALDPPPPAAARAHLQLAQLALFHALYATHPCTLLDTLRAELAAPAARDAWERGLAPLVHSVRLHPALLTGSRAREADAARWARLEPHDVLAESRRLSLRAPERPAAAAAPSPAPAPAPPPPASPAPGSGAHAARALAAARPGSEPWFALGDRCGADSAPHTPLPADADSAEPPEAAVEATPENTPARETRPQFRFPTESGAVRAIGGRAARKETSPSAQAAPAAAGEAYAARIARVMAERRAAESPVAFAGAPPAAGVARPEPARPLRPPRPPPEPELGAEDREVLELTRARPAPGWPDEAAAPAPRPRDPRAGAPAPRSPRRPPQPPRPPRRPASCSPPRRPRASVAVQTVDTWPEPYEFLIADFYRDHPDDPMKEGTEQDPTSPCERLDAYLSELYRGGGGGGGARAGELGEQVALLHAQLMYERWRREAHAERNRRLLGKCRQTRALELQNGALKDRVRALTRERDELAARLARDAAAPAAPAAPAAGAAPALAAALRQERDARVAAEAALHEAEAQRALDAAELQRIRGESFESARHVEALARAALAAERRGEHVRRLRRELLILAEREARLSAVARRAIATSGAKEKATGEERALRAAHARAEAEAAAAAARAEAAAARAHELEAALAARDSAVTELKRMMRLAAEEHAARIKAMQDKYSALMKVVRAAEARHLERLAGEGPPGGARGAPATPPSVGSASSAVAAGLSLGPADCDRTRKLLQLDDDIDAPDAQLLED